MADDRRVSRRVFLGGSAALLLAACTSGGSERGSKKKPGSTTTTVRPKPPPELSGPAFTLGIASGDPEPDGVVLWTRLAPEPLAPGGAGGMPDETVDVEWEIAADEEFEDIVDGGVATAEPKHAHSVHVDVTGLDADTAYWYRFRVGDDISSVGRTRTAPAGGGDPETLRFAVVSCQHYESGYFTAFANLADEDVAFVAHLGDYIYEGGANPNALRSHDGPEPTDVAGYRNRYALYKRDADLQTAHAALPFVVTWDDHEVEDNYAGELGEDLPPVEEFRARRAAAYQAWWEHQPVRLPPPESADYRIYRKLAYGSVLDLFVLDTRQYRSDQPCVGPGGLDIGAMCEEASRSDATMLGAEQEAWLDEGLSGSKAAWKVLAQGIIMGRVDFAGGGGIFNLDQWDGYPEARSRLLDDVPSGTLVVTGDVHSSWVNDLKLDYASPEAPVVAVEVGGTAITSTFPFPSFLQDVKAGNPDVKYVDGEQHGYVVVALEADRAQADFRFVSTITEPTATVSTGASFVTMLDAPGGNPVK